MNMSASQVLTIKPGKMPSKSSSALRAAASASLNLQSDPQPVYSSKLNLKASSMLKAKTPKVIETVEDKETKQMTKTRELVDPVVKRNKQMADAFDDASQGRKEQRQMMDEMHADCKAQVDQTECKMKETLSTLRAKMEEFRSERKQLLTDTMDELQQELHEKVEKLNAHFSQLESRASALQQAIDEERSNRESAMEKVLAPVREQVARLTAALRREEEIRTNRHRELKTRLDNTLQELDEVCTREQKNRQDRHDDIVHSCEAEQKRLLKRQTDITNNTGSHILELQSDLSNETKFRLQGQDRVAEKITDFIQKFQSHITEEGQMGN